MKLKRKDVVRLHNTLTAISEFAKGELAYAVIRNLKKLEPEIAAISKLEPQVPNELREYETERINVVTQYAEKDENGAAVIKNNNYIIPEKDKEAFNNSIGIVTAKYKPSIDAYSNAYQEYEKLLEVETDFEPYEIKQAHISSEITAKQLAGISELIEGLN